MRSSAVSWTLGAMVSAAMLASCGGGGSSSGAGATGSSTVRGNVVSVVATAPQHTSGVSLALLLKTIAAAAHAQTPLSGLTVTLADQTTVTDSGGSFIFDNVPPGDQILTIGFGANSATTVVNVPPNSVLVVANIVVNGGSAIPGSVSVAPGMSDSGNSGGNGGASNDNTANDNTSIGNNNANDNRGDDDNDNNNDNDNDNNDNDNERGEDERGDDDRDDDDDDRDDENENNSGRGNTRR